MARKTVLVCDNCGKEVGEGKGAVLRVTYTDARRGAKAADLCDDCAGKMPGHAGRPPRPPAQGGRATDPSPLGGPTGAHAGRRFAAAGRGT